MRQRFRRPGRVGCLLEIMLAVLFALVHFAVAWRLSGLWPRVTALPPGSTPRVLFSIYWWPPMRMYAALVDEAGVPASGVTSVMLIPLSWLTCFAYGWLTAIVLSLSIRLLRRSR